MIKIRVFGDVSTTPADSWLYCCIGSFCNKAGPHLRVITLRWSPAETMPNQVTFNSRSLWDKRLACRFLNVTWPQPDKPPVVLCCPCMSWIKSTVWPSTSTQRERSLVLTLFLLMKKEGEKKVLLSDQQALKFSPSVCFNFHLSGVLHYVHSLQFLTLDNFCKEQALKKFYLVRSWICACTKLQ